MKQQLTRKLATNDIAVVITSALYVDKLGETLTSIDSFRLERLQQTIATTQTFQFAKIIVIDATLTDDFVGTAYVKEEVDFIRTQSTFIKQVNEYQVYGPSRLEIDLMANSALPLTKLLANYKYVLKLSAGYSVKNLKAILVAANGGVVYRFGDPFRRKVRFCLSSFYLLPTSQFLSFIGYAAAKMDLVTKSYPLEAVLYDFIQTQKTQSIAIDYPVIKATFLSSQTNSNSQSFQVKLKVYQLLSKLGLYARSVIVSNDNHPVIAAKDE